MFEKNRKYSEMNKRERMIADVTMRAELIHLPKAHPIRNIFYEAWNAYQLDRFSYDGATFVKERHKRTIFEIAALVHDWRNSSGCVGREADQEMFDIMIRLNYPLRLLLQRWFFTRFTWINKLRHMCLKTYCRTMPANLYKLSDY
jgi:hypothetical protein